jgi:branched-chain amino acid aminotransferase
LPRTELSDRPDMASLIGGGSDSAEPPPYVWRNGELVPWGDATIQLHDFIYAAPSIVFEGVKAYSGAGGLTAFRLDDHLDRFYDSMKMLRMRPALAKEDLKAGVKELVRADGYNEDVYIVPFAFWSGGGLSRAFSVPEPERTVELCIVARPFSSPLATRVALNCCVSSWLRVPDAMAPPRVKAVANYYSWRLAYADAHAGGFDSLIMLGPSGKVSEGPGACVFLCRDGAVITPDTVSGILEGITRDTALKLLADELKLRVVERSVDRSEFYVSDEAFFAGTGLEIAAIASLDAIPIGDGEVGPITSALQSLYDDVVRGRKSGYMHWLTRLSDA